MPTVSQPDRRLPVTGWTDADVRVGRHHLTEPFRELFLLRARKCRDEVREVLAASSKLIGRLENHLFAKVRDVEDESPGGVSALRRWRPPQLTVPLNGRNAISPLNAQ